MALLLLTAPYMNDSIPPGMVILAFALLSIFSWYRFGRSLPRLQPISHLIGTSLIGKSPLILVTLILYSTYLIKGSERCPGAVILLMILGAIGTIIGLIILFFGYRSDWS